MFCYVDRHIVIKIQGVRPDNILFLIHEVFEGLVNESFFGVTYDIAFPCPDCVELVQFSLVLISIKLYFSIFRVQMNLGNFLLHLSIEQLN